MVSAVQYSHAGWKFQKDPHFNPLALERCGCYSNFVMFKPEHTLVIDNQICSAKLAGRRMAQDLIDNDNDNDNESNFIAMNYINHNTHDIQARLIDGN